jgi:hypothetical protein
VPDQEHLEFNDWLVPGVGLAPVTAFRVLITLFVLLIGPVNYWLLKRYQRLHLLVITVPLAAVMLTASLFAYALIADGLSTRVRARSFTLLDQRTGEAATWARLSYYSGLAPGRGLTIGNDTAIYPIIPPWQGESWSGRNTELRVARSLVWSGDEARLTRGWLRSRTPIQYLTLRSRQSPARLQLTQRESQMRAQNDLGAVVRYVVAVDAAGKLFAVENLAIGAAVELVPIERADAAKQFRKWLENHRPQSPAALAGVDATADYSVFPGPVYRAGASGNVYQTGTLLSDSVLNQALMQWTNFDDDPLPGWRHRTFVAVTETGPEVDLGLDNAREEASFHVVAGRW